MPRLTVYVNGNPLEVDLCPEDDLTSMACEVEKLDKRVNPAFPEISADGQEKNKLISVLLSASIMIHATHVH